MLTEKQRSVLFDNIDTEIARSGYPEGYPTLPDVPGGRYTDGEFHDLEIEHVFKKTWLWAGHVSEIPQSGSYKLFDRIGLSVIICRDKDDQVRAYHNVCRHRGSAILTQAQGKVPRFVCPYHAWTYDLGGRLLAVPEEYNFRCLDKASHSLTPVRCEVWRGMIFINLDDNAGPLVEFLGDVVELTAHFPLEKLELKLVSTFEVDCNWKAVRDNFMEVYHVNPIHPQTAAPWVDLKSFTAWIYKNGHSTSILKNKFHRVSGDDKPFPAGTDEIFRNHIMNVNVFPNLNFVLDSGGFSFLNIWPVGGADKAVLEFPMMGWRDDVDDVDVPGGYWETLMKSSNDIADEDVMFLGTIQKSLESGYFEKITLSYGERCLYWCHEEIDRLIGGKGVPEKLRVEPVMAPYVDEYPWGRAE